MHTNLIYEYVNSFFWTVIPSICHYARFCRPALTIITEIVTIIGLIWTSFTIYGFRKTKRIENNALEARRALDELVQIEELLRVLFLGPDDVKRSIALHQKLSSQIDKLRNTLWFLDDYEDIFNETKLLYKLIEVISKYQKSHDYNIAAEDIKNLLNWEDDGKSRLSHLRDNLRKIYKMKK